MKSIQALREQRDKAAAKLREMVENNGGEKWTEAHQKDFDDTKAAISDIDAEIKRTEEVIALGGSGSDSGSDDSATATAGRAVAEARVEIEHKPVYKNVGEQLQDVYAMTTMTSDAPKARDRFEKVVNAAGASTGIDSEGGYLVETDKSTEILSTVTESGVFSSRCERQPISAHADSFSYMAEKDRDQSSRSLNVYRKGELDEMKDSGKLKFEERELRVEDMYGLISVSNRMLRDASALAAYTKRKLRKAFPAKLDFEVYEGSGSGECLGLMNSDILIQVPKEEGQAAGSIVAQNLLNMLARFHGNILLAEWFVSQEVLPILPTLTIGDKPVFIPGGSLANAPFGVLLGRPIIPTEHNEVLGTCGDILLADWSEYLIVEKGGMEEAESMHVKFLTDEMVFRFIQRNSGAPIDDQPIIPRKSSLTRSPFVTLADRK